MANIQEGAANPEPPAQAQDPKTERMRSAVRVRVTYAAAFFLFGAGAGFAGYFIAIGEETMAKDLFFAILPIAAAVVTYWFATRKGGALTGDDIAKIMNAAKNTDAR